MEHGKPDGTPPNNWLSIFGGSGWQWDPTRMQYYMHNFLTSQPDLNLHNPEVQEELLNITRFWLKRGSMASASTRSTSTSTTRNCATTRHLRRNAATPQPRLR